jgi:hypothetical protein
MGIAGAEFSIGLSVAGRWANDRKRLKNVPAAGRRGRDDKENRKKTGKID